MIPRLFPADADTFTNFGICPLPDCLSCTVEEERNGAFTLELEYPRDGQWVEELAVDRIILADPRDNSAEPEPFRIYEVEYDMTGNVKVQANHISYQLNDVLIGQFAVNTRYPATAWQWADNAKLTDNPFTFYTDISDDAGAVHRFESLTVTPMRKMIGGMEGSLLDSYGGELEWNRYTVKLWSSRGADNGVKIAYTKNLTGLEYDIDMSNVYTGAVAYYNNNGTYVQGTLQTVTNGWSYNRTIVLDATQDFDSTPTQAQLNTYAAQYLSNNAPAPNISVEVEFVPLWQTEEYKEYYGLEHVGLCDTVTVLYPPLNLSIKAKVVKTAYNVLADRYDKITISTIRSSLADIIFGLMEAENG